MKKIEKLKIYIKDYGNGIVGTTATDSNEIAEKVNELTDRVNELSQDKE